MGGRLAPVRVGDTVAFGSEGDALVIRRDAEAVVVRFRSGEARAIPLGSICPDHYSVVLSRRRVPEDSRSPSGLQPPPGA